MSFLFQPIPSAAEQLSDSPTVTLDSLSTLAPFGTASTNTPTLGKLQAGSFAMKWVALIEGCDITLSDGPEAAVQAALSGTDWASSSVVSGLFVELRNEQSIDPSTAFATGGRLVLRVLDTDGNDTFGTLVHKRLSGAETELTQTADRDDETLNVKSTTGFTSSGTVYLGAEAIKYTGTTATTFTGCTRGYQCPFFCDSTGTGTRFANHHRWGVDTRYIQAQPVVTQVPRVWIGRRVALYLHTWDGSAMNTLSAAQLVYAGRIVGIADDPGTFTTVLDVEHMAKEWEEGVIGKDIFQAEIPQGMWIAAGRRFEFADGKSGTNLDADDLVVVSSGASTSFELNEGFYSLGELCEKINEWLAAAFDAGQIHGSYSWASPVSYRNDGLRTVCQWVVEDASTVPVHFTIRAPLEVLAFLGIKDIEPAQSGEMGGKYSGVKYSNESNATAGDAVPYSSVIFRPAGPGRIGQEYGEELIYDLENIRGTFTDQRSLLPDSVRQNIPSDQVAGLFILDEKAIMAGVYDSANQRFKNCWLAPYRRQSDDANDEALTYIGRRADEPQSPVSVRQIFILVGTVDTIIKSLAYSTGASGFNGTYDTLGAGLGLGIPGSLLGPEFDRSVSNLPGADAPMAVVIEEPIRFSELMSADLLIRRAFIRWRDQGFEIGTWSTPSLAKSVATLTEGNKAEPSGHVVDHRTASLETDMYQRTSVKIDYERDFASGRDGKYLKSVQIEDQGATDQTDGATGSRVMTLKMRNTYSDFASTGSAVEALIPGYMATMPMFSRPAHQVSRSIDLRYFEGIAVGDIVTYTDSYARDPLTGRRSTSSRPAIVTRIWCDYGGPEPQGGEPRKMAGGIELAFLDLHRGSGYSPSADVDDTATLGGFSAGYNNTTKQLRCKPHAFSQVISFPTKRGYSVTIAEARDASHFEAGDEIVIVERDPADPTSPDTWTRTVDSVSGDDITLTTTLSFPAWSSSKRYRIISAPYTDAQATQQDDIYQADDDDLMILDTDPPFHFAASSERHDYEEIGVLPRPELLSTSLYGDGKPQDVGTDKMLANNLDLFIDAKSCAQSPMLVAGSEIASLSLGGSDFDDGSGMLFMFPIFTGLEQPSSPISRVLTVAPWFRSSDGQAAYVRISITSELPTVPPASDENTAVAGYYGNPRFTGSSSTIWSTTSTTWTKGDDYDLPMIQKNDIGCCWIIIEGSGAVECRGLAKCRESARRIG